MEPFLFALCANCYYYMQEVNCVKEAPLGREVNVAALAAMGSIVLAGGSRYADSPPHSPASEHIAILEQNSGVDVRRIQLYHPYHDVWRNV